MCDDLITMEQKVDAIVHVDHLKDLILQPDTDDLGYIRDEVQRLCMKILVVLGDTHEKDLTDWRHEVSRGDTLLSFAEWIDNKRR